MWWMSMASSTRRTRSADLYGRLKTSHSGSDGLTDFNS
jgi:hypothetical protein